MKITILGAGAVGATCAEHIARLGIVEQIVLVDVKPGLAEGKAKDIQQSLVFTSSSTVLHGVTDDYRRTKDSGLCIVTCGLPRKSGMSREELLSCNSGIITNVMKQLHTYSPDAIYILVSNPLDAMTYLASKSINIPRYRIIGMGGILDSARFQIALSSALQCPSTSIDAIVIGGHGDSTMIPLLRLATKDGLPVHSLLNQEQSKNIISDTMNGGKILVELMETSTMYGPSAAITRLVQAIIMDTKSILPCSVMLQGEYGYDDVCVGVPIIIGRSGWESVVEVDLDENEKKHMSLVVQHLKLIQTGI